MNADVRDWASNSRAEILAAGFKPAARAGELALTGGDDYELLFSVAPARLAEFERALPSARWNYRRIGVLRAAPGARVMRGGNVMQFSHSGFDHFAR